MIGWRPFACLAFSVAVAGGAGMFIAGAAAAGAVGPSAPAGHSRGATTGHKTKPGKLHISVAPAAGTPAETVSPSTGLTNGETVTVAVTGFPAGALLAVVECAPPATQQSLCNTGKVKFITTNGSGAGSTPFVVTTGQQGSDPSSVCPPSSGDCQITAADIALQQYNSYAYIVFASQTTTTTTTSVATTTTTVASGGTTTVPAGGTTSTVASGGSTTTAASGGGSSPSSSAGSGSGSSSNSSDPSLANTGTPADTSFVAGLALLLITAGLVATLTSRRRRI